MNNKMIIITYELIWGEVTKSSSFRQAQGEVSEDTIKIFNLDRYYNQKCPVYRQIFSTSLRFHTSFLIFDKREYVLSGSEFETFR